MSAFEARVTRVRRLLAAVLLVTPLVQAASGASAYARPRPHECDDHVCLCRRPATPPSAPSAAAAAMPCHGSEAAPEDGPRLSGTCRHFDDAAPLFGSRPGLVERAPLAVPLEPETAVVPPLRAHGGDRPEPPDPPPPKAD
jgi:hypothetical protein